jgi:D-alanyl-D-alanine carboxypeptidase
MYRVPAGTPRAFRCGTIGLLGAFLLVALSVDAAEARWRKRASPSKTGATSIVTESRYAHIVVDGNSGDVLDASNADSLRHPASLTKIMTLYLLFERIEAGKIRLDTPLNVSANATQQPPTKLGTPAGQTIAVEDAIKALVTKSANDIAVVVAESLGGSEDEFARMMTRKARALGMSRTVYRNASGLPDDEQVTTARDQALLGLAIQDRFPRYYRYFSTSSFVYRGRAITNHNRLLGRVEGVDGIKTGYTHASGFNLVSSVRRGPRFVVAAVFGGRTASQRDARMRDLIEAHVTEASLRRTAPKIIEIADAAAARPAKTRVADAAPAVASSPAVKYTSPAREAAAKEPIRAPEAVSTAAIPPRPAAGSTDPIRPNVVKTVSVKAGPAQAVAVAPLTLLSPQPVSSQAHATLTTRREPDLPTPPPGAKAGVLGVLPAKSVAAAPSPPAAPAPMPAPVQTASAAPVAPAPFTTASVTTRPAPPAPSEMRAAPRGGWIIQVGAFEDIGEAKERLSSAKSKAAKLLEHGDPFTEPVVKGDKTLYRARFAGLNQEQAEAACKHLKRSDIACMAMRN